jgi:hypothetical protein
MKAPAEITIKDIYNAFENMPPLPYWEVPSTESEVDEAINAVKDLAD